MAWETTQTVKVKVNGETVELQTSEVDASRVIELAKQNGLSRFTVKLNGDEIASPSEFNGVKGGDVVEIVPYDEWGV